MSYRKSFMLGAASMALAHGTPQYGHGPVVNSASSAVGSPLMFSSAPAETGAPYSTLTPASGTGVLPTGAFPTGALPTGAFPTGVPHSGFTAVPSGYPVGVPPTEPNPSGPSPICLTPVVLPGHDTQNPDNVDPKYKHTLHYSGASSPGE